MGTSGQDAASTVFSLIEEEKLGIVKQLHMEVNHEVSIPSVAELFRKDRKHVGSKSNLMRRLNFFVLVARYLNIDYRKLLLSPS